MAAFHAFLPHGRTICDLLWNVLLWESPNPDFLLFDIGERLIWIQCIFTHRKMRLRRLGSRRGPISLLIYASFVLLYWWAIFRLPWFLAIWTLSPFQYGCWSAFSKWGVVHLLEKVLWWSQTAFYSYCLIRFSSSGWYHYNVHSMRSCLILEGDS